MTFEPIEAGYDLIHLACPIRHCSAALYISILLGEWSGYSLQILAPFAFAQAAVGFPLLSLPGKSVLVFELWRFGWR
jgi:hypothetical protein